MEQRPTGATCATGSSTPILTDLSVPRSAATATRSSAVSLSPPFATRESSFASLIIVRRHSDCILIILVGIPDQPAPWPANPKSKPFRARSRVPQREGGNLERNLSLLSYSRSGDFVSHGSIGVSKRLGLQILRNSKLSSVEESTPNSISIPTVFFFLSMPSC